MAHVQSHLKTVELRGGRNAGNRIDVPADLAEIGLPVHSVLGFIAVETYRRTDEHAPDGVEYWLHASALSALH